MAIEILPEPSIPITTPFRPGLGFLTATPIIAAATICLALVIASAILAPWLSPHDPLLLAPAQRLKPASAQFLLGTDGYGRDVLSRILYGGRISLALGVSVAVVAVAMGTAVGGLAGYCRGWIDQALMRLTDLLLVIPGLALLMIAQKGLGSSTVVIVGVLSMLFWRGVARVVRSVMLSLREREFIEAARASGASAPRILITEMLPNAVGVICVQAPLAVAAAILTESTLSFLGFGIQPPAVSWGSMLAQSRGAVGTHLTYLVYSPGLAILVTVLAVNFVGNGLRDAFDPQSDT